MYRSSGLWFVHEKYIKRSKMDDNDLRGERIPQVRSPTAEIKKKTTNTDGLYNVHGRCR